MLRPATPLTVLLFTAFVLLLISVLSTPIIKQIPLASFGGVDFGVFGFCQGSRCSNIEIGYSTDNLFSAAQSASFDLPDATRHTLSAILIVHPIAAFFTLVMLILGAAAHFHSPSHSPRYLLGIFILSILTLLVSLLAFLIDVLLFVPHMAWGSYVVLAATILIAASGIVSCAMRRTLVSRKARKRRIAENAEMNGENFYNRQAADPAPIMSSANNMVNGAPGADKLPTFATFDNGKKDPDQTSDERLPLTTRTPSETSPNNGLAQRMNDPYGLPPRAQTSLDQYGNPMRPPPGSYGMRSRDPSADPSLSRQYSDPSMNMRGRGMPYRGRGGPNRGGYGPPRGGYGPPRGGYGPPRGGNFGPPRGGYGAPYRGGMNDGVMAGAMMRGGMGGGPPGYNSGYNSGYNNRGVSPAGSLSRRPPPPESGPGYGNAYQQQPPLGGGYATYNPDDRSSLPRAESPPPLPGLESGLVGQAVEMDATTGSPSTAPIGYNQFGNMRESDSDVAGMVGLQQQRLQRQTADSDPSRYSVDEPYVPPRQAWQSGDGRSSPLSRPSELPGQSGHRRGNSGDNYYEDVDPQFAEPQVAAAPPVSHGLAPGYGPNDTYTSKLRPSHPIGGLDGNNSNEDLQSGARSPAESDRSNFTSVSQRGVNPRWNGGPGYAPMPTRRPLPQQQDILLNSNPDFQLPGGRGGRGIGRGGRGPSPAMIPGSTYPGGSL